MVNNYQERILKYVNIMNNTKDIAKAMKVEELKVQSSILTLARKQLIASEKAHSLLKGSNMEKFIDRPSESHLKKPLTVANEKFVRVSIK